MKIKYKLMILIGIIFFLTIVSITIYNFYAPDYLYTQEYLIGQSNIKGNVNIKKFADINDAFEIGANKYGYAVFKQPRKAFKQAKKEFKAGIKLIKKEFNLTGLSQLNYEKYGDLGCQVTMGNLEEQQQARLVCAFMDIYSNSYK